MTKMTLKRKLTVAVFVATLVCLLPVLGLSKDEKKLKPGKIDSRIFVLKGDNAWLNTGFVVTPKDKITITASGEISFSNGESYSEVGPDGYSRQAFEEDFVLEDAAYCLDPIQEERHAGLIGKDKNGMFVIGESTVLTGKNGALFIGINDCSFKKQFYNTGEFSVAVKILRGQ